MLILGMLVRQKSITNSNEEVIREFLSIIPCLFKPLRIPNIVLAGKRIGAAIEQALMYRPKSLRF